MGWGLVWGRECGGMGVSGLGEVGWGLGNFAGERGRGWHRCELDVLEGVGEGEVAD